MVIPQGVNIPMPRPFGGIPPAISKTPLGEDAAGGELITVSLVGEIGPITQYLELFDALDTASENDEVRIVLDTPGGDVYTSQQIVGRMESCKAKVTTVASGLVASAGTFIWLYGQKQEIERWARFMFHSSLHGDWGKSLAIQENAAELVKFMAQILSNAEKRGILIAAEVQRILKGKGDVEISGAEARKRLAMLADGDDDAGDDGDPNPEDPNTDPGTGDDDGEPTEGETNDNPSAKRLTKKSTVKKSKKRISQGEGDPEPGEGDDDDGEPKTEPAEPAPAEGDDGKSIQDIFNAICEENGVETPPETTETQTTEEPPVETPANKGKTVKKTKKRRSQDDDPEPGEGDPEPGEGDDDDGEPGEGDDGDGEPGEGEPPAARRGKKPVKKTKKRRAEGGDDDGEPGEGEPPAEGDDDDDGEPNEGDDNGDGNDGDGETIPEETSVQDLFNMMCEENGVEAPPPAEGDNGEGNDDDGEPAEGDDDDGDDGEPGEGEPPSAKCGKRKSKKPAKKRRGEEPGETVITEPGEADQNSHLRQVPSSRHW